MPSFVLIFSVATRNCMGTVYIKSIKSGSEIIKGLSVYPTSNKQYLWEEKRFLNLFFWILNTLPRGLIALLTKIFDQFLDTLGHTSVKFCRNLFASFFGTWGYKIKSFLYQRYFFPGLFWNGAKEAKASNQTEQQMFLFDIFKVNFLNNPRTRFLQDKEKNDVWVHMKMPQGIEFLYFAALSPAKTKFLTDEEFTVSWFCNSNTSF